MVTDYQSIMDGLTEEEKEEALKILGELSQDGKSDTLQKIYEADYEEIPVDIDTFIDSPEYAGWFTGDGKNIYPYWRQKLREIFSDRENYTEIAISGGVGTGKSHIAVLALAYCLYKLMCLKDPYAQFNMAKGSFIYIVFFNATLQLSQGVAYTKFQSLLINSPWFQQRGTVGGTKYLEYIPNKPIRFTVGSQMEHSIGKDILCMTGDTVIYTIDGCKTLKSLEGSSVRVYTKYSDGSIKLSDKAVEIVKTKSVNEIYEIELEDGSILRCTENHRLKLKSGDYVEVQNLTEDMELDGCICATLSIHCITKITLDNSIDVYDVVNVPETHNFLVKINSGYIVSHNCGILDEVNFVKGADVNLEKSKIMKLYSSVLERINSRFIVRGKVMGKLFLVSSKRAESDFIENYIKKQQDKPGIYTIDAKIWETKPKGTYSGKWFKVAIGGIYKPSKIIREDENVEDYIKQDYRIMDIPIEFIKSFEMDMNTALMNVAGVSISNTTRFIGYANLSKCYKEHKNPFTTNIITTGLYDKLTIKDFFIPDVVKPDIYGRPIFIHIDTSLTGDRTGISAVAVMGYKNVNEYSIESGDIETTKELFYHHIFTVGIQCPSNSEISFQKTRDFIYYLRYNLGWYIFGISCDGFQSRDTIQQLITAGFSNSKVVSLDKTPDGYLVYKNAINEQRINHINIPELEFEIINLARDNQTGKVDHDIDKCFTGDTKIKLVDGRDLTILELMQEQDYKTNWVYTFNETTQKIEPKPIKKVFQTMITKELVKVTLDNGESVTCTPNHRFMLRDGSYKESKDLYEGCSLMPLYTNKNHKVVSIEFITMPSRVYDIEVVDNHNFALSCGVIVHNSKDLSDSLAGAVYNASQQEQELNLYMIDSHEIMLEANEWTDEDTTTQDLLSKMVANKIEEVPKDIPVPFRDSTDSEDDNGFFFM